MVPVLGGEVEEGEQRFPIFGQAGDCLVVLGAVFVGEHVDRRLGRRAGRRAVYLAKVGLHIDLNREGDLVQHVGGFVNPTALVPGKTSSIAFQKPSAPSPTARSGAISSPRCLMSSRSSRQLCALSRTPVWKPTNSFLPSVSRSISTSMHSAACSIRAYR